MKISSTSFENNRDIPVKHANLGVINGKNISPNFSFADVPSGTKSLALALIDYHPIASNWVHWIVINIPPAVSSITEGASKGDLPPGSKELINSFGKNGYGGPEPPRGSGKHNYTTTVYALNIDKIEISGRITEREFLAKIKNHIIDKAVYTGYFSR